MYFFAYIIKMPLSKAVAFLCPKDCVKLFLRGIMILSYPNDKKYARVKVIIIHIYLIIVCMYDIIWV